MSNVNNPPSTGAPAANGAQGHTRRQSAVTVAKGPVGAAKSAGINFGSAHDQNAMLSSSPAVQPSSGQHLQGSQPSKFGSLPAETDGKKVVGFAAGKDNADSTNSPATPSAGPAKAARTMDFQKMFQGNSAASSSSGAPDAAAASSNGNATASPTQHNSNPAARSNLRPPGQGQVPGSRPFESQRSPSQPHHAQSGSRATSGGPGGPPSPFQPHHGGYGHPQGGPQQPRSPHMAHAQAMQPMGHQMGGPQWQGQQPMYYPMYAHAPGYGYPAPQHWNGPQAPFDPSQPGQQPRSPRHANMPASPMHAAAGGAPSTPGLASPASSRATVAPHTPSTQPSSVASPTGSHAHLGLGHAPGARPPAFQSPGGFGHSPSHSFSNSMSASARQFEPVQKRTSSAIRIVNPETNATVDLQAAAKTAPPASPAPTPASPAPAAASGPSTPAAGAAAKSKLKTNDDFMAKVQAAAAAAKAKKEADEKAYKEAQEKEKKEAEDKAKREAEEKAAAEKAAAEAKAKEEADKKAAEEKAAREEAERKEREAKEKAEAEAAAKAKAEAEAAAAAAAEEAEKKTKEQAEERDKLAPIDTSNANAGNDEGAASAAGGFRGTSVADIERMAREASSVPSTPLEGPPRTPMMPTTPRTPGTPGFANLPAKPLSTLNNNNGIKLDAEALEKRKRPSVTNIDVTASRSASISEAPQSAASAALGSARFIEDIKSVTYPEKIASPKPELNESAEPGRFRYDRDFLLQFMGVYREKPQDLPPLSAIRMEGSQIAGSRAGPSRRASGMGPPAAPGRGALGLGIGGGSSFGGKSGGMGSFGHPAKTSEERFAASSSRMGAFGSGPMGSFNAGARSQPLSRTGSGSGALPSRDVMGTAIPAGGRVRSNRGKARGPGDGGGRGDRPPPSGNERNQNITIPADQIQPLEQTENRWIGGRGAPAPKADSPEMVQRKVKALLNKLTLEKFESISNQILEWADKSVNETDGRTLRQVIALIFEKATDEAAFSEMYARLCRKLMELLSQDVKDESLKGSDNKPVVGGTLFRKYLINRCQEDFERGWAARDATAAAAKSKEAEDKAKNEANEKAAKEAKEAEERGEKPKEQSDAALLSDEYYEAQKAKRRGLGLVRFIGELFRLQMLTDRVMHLCCKKLLANVQDPEEEEIESLCKLMTTVGKLLDSEKNRNYIDVYFTRMREMMDSPNVNSRMRFMLQDVLELRQNNWTPRNISASTGPKTIAQIHEDAAKAKAQAEVEQAARVARGAPLPPRGGSRRGQPRGDFGVDSWSTVGGPAPPPRQAKVGDLSGFGKGINRTESNRPLAIGPQSIFAKKNQRSEDGSNPPSRTSSTSNMFHLLGDQAGESGEAKADAAGASGEGSAAPEPQRKKLNLAPRTLPLPSEDKAGADADADDKEDDKSQPSMSQEQADRKITSDVKEFLSIRDLEEGKLALEELPSEYRAKFIDRITGDVVGKKEDEVRLVGKLFATARDAGLLDDATFEAGFKDHVEFLDDVAIDVPNAYTYMAILLNASALPEDKVEALASTIQGDGLKPPKQKLLEKVAATKE